MKQFKIKEEDKNIRIDKIINNLEEDISRTAIQRMIEQGNILVNGKKVRTSYKVCIDDLITIEEEQPQETNLLPENIPLDIIYQDEDILIINKPKGMVVHPGNRKSRWNISKCCNGNMQR